MSETSSARAPRLVVLVGPSGSGKTTLARRLMDRRSDEVAFSVSHTTRPMRQGEIDGRDYHFLARDIFEKRRDEGAFAEWAEVHGNLYGTAKAEIERHLERGQDLLFDIDIVGAHHLHAAFAQHTLLIFVLPPSWSVMVARLQGRGSETEETLRRRLRTARRELQGVLGSPYSWQVLENDDLDAAVLALEVMVSEPRSEGVDLSKNPLIQDFWRDALADERAAP